MIIGQLTAHEPVSFWWEKCGRHHHFTTSFCKNVKVAKKKYIDLKGGKLMFYNHKIAKLSSGNSTMLKKRLKKNSTMLIYSVFLTKTQGKQSGIYFFLVIC